MSPAVGDSIRRRRPAVPRRSGEPLHWRRIVLWSLGGLLAAFGFGYAFAVFVLFPAPEATTPGIAVPKLVGKDTLYALRTLGARGLRMGTVTPVPNPVAPLGMVVAQDALAGQQLRRGALVNVAVSAGATRATLPNLAGYPAARAAAFLVALGFQPTQQVVTADVPAGQVVSVSPAPGVEYEVPAQVVLTVSAGPPPPDTTAVQDSTAADTTGAAGIFPPQTSAAPAQPPAGSVAPAHPAPAPGTATPAVPPRTSAPVPHPRPDTSRKAPAHQPGTGGA